jgi:uncharacterized protein
MNKIELEIVSLTHSVTQSHSFAVILGEKHGKRRIPIVIGNAEAQAIAIALENIVPTRPLTHDLMRDMLFSFEVNIEEVIIHNLIDGIFYSTIVCKHNNETYEFDSRTSDAVALSTRFKCPIYTYETILETAGVSIEENDIIESEQPPARQEEATPQRKENDYAALSTAELEKQLQRALESEDYEKAATIRDEISKR